MDEIDAFLNWIQENPNTNPISTPVKKENELVEIESDGSYCLQCGGGLTCTPPNVRGANGACVPQVNV
jgi:hypothetical protein